MQMIYKICLIICIVNNVGLPVDHNSAEYGKLAIPIPVFVFVF